MADLDQLLRGDLAHLAAEAATVPAYTPIERRGVTRRRTRSAAAMAASAAAVAVVGLAAFQVASGDRTAPGPTPSPIPTPTVERTVDKPTVDKLGADQIVDDPRAYPIEVVVAPDDPQIRAVVWRLCRSDNPCKGAQEAVALTDDGFATRHTTTVRFGVRYLGRGVFADDPGLGLPRILHPDGRVVEPSDIDRQTGPVRPGEVLVGYGSGIQRWAAVDSETGRGHAVDVPDGLSSVQVLGPDGRIVGQVIGSTDYTWSDDGGTTWSRTPLDTNRNPLTVGAASAVGRPLAVLEGGDGATLFPLIATHRSVDRGKVFQRLPLFPDQAARAYGQNAGVLPDGRLLLNVEAWSDDQRGGVHRRPVGLYVSNGTDWTDLRPLAQAEDYAGAQPDVVATATGLLVIYASEGVASTDAGQTWQPFELR